MKWRGLVKWLIVLIVALSGCKEQDMATTAKEFDVELVGTNVTIINPTGHGDYIRNVGLIIDDDYDVAAMGYTRECIKKHAYVGSFSPPVGVNGTKEAHPYPKFSGRITGYANDENFSHVIEGIIFFSGLEAGKEYTTVKHGIMAIWREDIKPTYPNISTLKEDGTYSNAWIWVTNGDTIHVEHNGFTETTYTFSDFARDYPDVLFYTNSDISSAISTVGGEVLTGGDGWRSVFNEFYSTKYNNPEFYVALRPINPFLPFDGMNTSCATAANIMTYTVKAIHKFNSFTLAGVTAESLTYTVKDSLGATVKTDTVVLDCTLDHDGLLPQDSATILVSVGQMVEADGTIQITLTNTGEVKLGSFTTNIAIDEGVTELTIKASLRDYNDYTPDSWGNIEEGVKAVTRKFDITVLVPYADFDKTYRRHKSYAGKFITLDGTDATLLQNSLTLYSLVARGIITSIGHETITKDKNMNPFYKYSMSFLEVV